MNPSCKAKIFYNVASSKFVFRSRLHLFDMKSLYVLISNHP